MSDIIIASLKEENEALRKKLNEALEIIEQFEYLAMKLNTKLNLDSADLVEELHKFIHSAKESLKL